LSASASAVPFGQTPAVRVGPDAWEWLNAADRSGRVGGRFRGGVNVVFGSEALVCLQSPEIPIHPWALVANLPWEEVAEGAPVTVSRGELSVGHTVLPLVEAEVVDLTFHPPEDLVSLEELRERVALTERLLAETSDPFESEFDRTFVRDRDRILAQWQETSNPEVLLDLIGRGPGTTPAGDDTLIGLLAGLEVLAAVSPLATGPSPQATRYWPARTFFYKPRATMLHAAPVPPTSLLSAQLLESAAAARFSQSLLSLQRSLAEPEATRAEVSRDARSSLSSGHTTGRSALLGLVAPLSSRELECTGKGLRVMHERETPLHSNTGSNCMAWGRDAGTREPPLRHDATHGTGTSNI